MHPSRAKGVEAISSTLSALPILGPDLFGEGASRKNRVQNYCEQDYPTSCRRDREDQAASPRHRELSVQARLGGAAAFNHAAATPNRAERMAGRSGAGQTARLYRR